MICTVKKCLKPDESELFTPGVDKLIKLLFYQLPHIE